MKAGLGMTAGVIGAFVGTPAEVHLVTMTIATRLDIILSIIGSSYSYDGRRPTTCG